MQVEGVGQDLQQVLTDLVGSVTASAASGSPVTLYPLGSASDPDGDSLTVSSVAPTNGSAVIVGGTSIQFTSASGFVGTAYVGYIISDGHGGTAAGLATLNVAAVPVTQFSIQKGSISLNPQTGLYDQQVTINNTGSGTAAAVRLKVEGLRAGIVLNNAAGFESGVPYAQHDAPLNPGDSVVLRLEYYVPDRQPFTNALSAEAVLPTPTASGSSGMAIDRSFVDRTNPADHSHLNRPGFRAGPKLDKFGRAIDPRTDDRS